MSYYYPEPGTVAWRAVAHLDGLPKGAEIVTSALAEAARSDAVTVSSCLQTALTHGLVFRRRKDSHPRSPWFWSLTDHSKTGQLGTHTLHAAPAEPPAAAPPAQAEPPAPSDEPQIPQFITPKASLTEPLVIVAPSPAEQAAMARTFDRLSTPGVSSKLAERMGFPSAETLQRMLDSKPQPLPTRFALCSDGTLEINRDGEVALLLSRDETRALVEYLDRISLDHVREGDVA